MGSGASTPLPIKVVELQPPPAKEKSRKFQTSVEDFEYFKALGKGGFGRVVKVRKKSNGMYYAMKIVPKARLINSIHKLYRERNVPAVVNHPFVSKLHWSLQTEHYAIMVLDLVTGRLSSLLRGNGPLGESAAKFYVAEIALALKHLHSLNLVYRDLKVDNVLLDGEGHVQLIDFGLVECIKPALGFPWEHDGPKVESEVKSIISPSSEDPLIRPENKTLRTQSGYAAPLQKGEESSIVVTRSLSHSFSIEHMRRQQQEPLKVAGTPGYIAPEILRLSLPREVDQPEPDAVTDNWVGQAGDFWALGALMYKLLTGRRPFPGATHEQRREDRVMGRGQLSELAAMYNHRMELADFWSDDVCDLLTGLLDFNPKTRLGCGPSGFEELKRHSFFRGLDWDALEARELAPPFLHAARGGVDNNSNSSGPLSNRGSEGSNRVGSCNVYSSLEECTKATGHQHHPHHQHEQVLKPQSPKYPNFESCLEGMKALFDESDQHQVRWWNACMLSPQQQLLFGEWDAVVERNVVGRKNDSGRLRVVGSNLTIQENED